MSDGLVTGGPFDARGEPDARLNEPEVVPLIACSDLSDTPLPDSGENQTGHPFLRLPKPSLCGSILFGIHCFACLLIPYLMDQGNATNVTPEKLVHLQAERKELTAENEQMKNTMGEQALEISILRDL